VSELSEDDTRWRSIGAQATLLDALPALVVDVAPGETFHIPMLDGWNGPVGVVLGRRGGVTGEALEQAVTLTLEIPDVAGRERHWSAALSSEAPLDELAKRFRMTGGNIRRTAALARAEAALAERDQPTAADVNHGVRELHGRLFDTLATRVPTESDWDRIAVRQETMRELRLLEARCRQRERLGEFIGAGGSDLTAGVRALLTGPSGTGKTLAARTLAGVLGIDLYRVDLSMVVNKYLGETEKNLNTLFSRAEEADAALLLDEGDALLTRRTDVYTSNDRYANLETNFLLQRLESFDGILLVTTNAGDRIDDAFRRRMDVVVDFGAPDELERWAIWQIQLPERHEVSDDLLEELAVRCALTGGQMRNAVLHASLLALEDGEAVRSDHLETAVRREYVKAGQVCPLAAEIVLG
jgi:SpoVK/Ycf46/Vps4 family AAA+-type ATPase